MSASPILADVCMKGSKGEGEWKMMAPRKVFTKSAVAREPTSNEPASHGIFGWIRAECIFANLAHLLDNAVLPEAVRVGLHSWHVASHILLIWDTAIPRVQCIRNVPLRSMHTDLVIPLLRESHPTTWTLSLQQPSQQLSSLLSQP